MRNIPVWVQKLETPVWGDNPPGWEETPECVHTQDPYNIKRHAKRPFRPVVYWDAFSQGMLRYITLDELREHPEQAIKCLMAAILKRDDELRQKGEDELEPRLAKLIFGWILARHPITQKHAITLLQQNPTMWERMMINHWAGRHGRRIILRHAAIKALFLVTYLDEPWLNVTKRVCPCGDSHLDSNKVVALCQPKLETDVRILRRLLRDCQITLPFESGAHVG